MDATHGDLVLLAHQLYTKTLELEKQFWALIEARGPFDPNVRIIRNTVRENYKIIILNNHEFSEQHDIEQLLWRLHYKQIEEYRVRLRKNTSTSENTSCPGALQGNKLDSQYESRHNILASFKCFLSEASGFYHDLIRKIRTKYGFSQEFISFEVTEGSISLKDNKGFADFIRCQLSCHRCLIYLGDLARYKELHTYGDLVKHDWSVATGYYLHSASICPSSGNPHNQLAVLASYMSDELLAMYHYFRSLAAESPFLTARDNLTLLFEKNRIHYLQLTVSVGNANSYHVKTKNGNSDEGTGRGDSTFSVGIVVTDELKVDTEKQHAPCPLTPSKILTNLRVRFVRLNGILFTRIGMETFFDVLSGTVDDVDQIFSHQYDIGEPCLNSDYIYTGGDSICVAALALQLVASLIFSINNVTLGSEAHQPTYTDGLQQCVFLQHAYTAAFHCTGQLIQNCADAEDVSASSLLPAILIYLEWLACRPTITMELEIEEKQEEARLLFWRGLASLLNKLIEVNLIDSNKDDFKAAIASHSNPFQGKSEWRIALWEDYELQGFTPLAPAQLSLQYCQRTSVSPSNKKERLIRIQRLIMASKFVSSLEEDGKGMSYDQETFRFHDVKDNKPRMKSKKNRKGALLDTGYSINRSEILSNTGFISSMKKKLLLNVQETAASNIKLQPNNESGDEKDEVIVYRPLNKESWSIQT